MKKFNLIPESEWPNKNQETLRKVFLNRDFLVQQFEEGKDVIRLSICRTKRKGSRWADGIAWDEIQEIKSLVGFGDKCAVEIYPENRNVVNVANMRHIFIVPEAPWFAWEREK